MTAVTPSRSGVSPSSSPRLPSPPPIPEVQFGPKSPGIDLSKELSLDAASKPDEGAARRIRPGTKAADMATGPPLIPLNQLDSPFQLQEHLKSLCSHLMHNPESTHTVPITKETALQLATPPRLNETESVDRNLWLYELCRFLTQKANVVSIFLMNDNPPCSSTTCPEMRASEWQYLCAVHEPPKSCCAIDYCNHTLDWAANVLTSPKHFPSRLALGGEAGNVIQSMRQLTNIFRRVYRIFAHAWFQHRDVFWSVEAIYGLYMLFKVVCDEYHLIPEDSYTIPPEAEGIQEAVNERGSDLRPHILQKDNTGIDEPPTGLTSSEISSPQASTISTAATTRRHKHTPSTGSHVATIAEGAEEEDEQPTSTISTKPSPSPSISQLVEAEDLMKDAGEEKRSLSPQPRNHVDKSPERRLPKLDISSSMPKFEPRAPEDPTPTGNTEDVDPIVAYQKSQETSSSSSNQLPKAEPVNESTRQPDTPIDQIIRPFDDEDETAGQKITSPSGGSIRTAGNDVLAAIMGHIHDGEDDSPPGSGHMIQRSDTVKPTVQQAPRAKEREDDDVEDDEGMSPVHPHAPSNVTTLDAGAAKEEGETHESPKARRDEVKISVEEAVDDDDNEEPALGSKTNEGVKGTTKVEP